MTGSYVLSTVGYAEVNLDITNKHSVDTYADMCKIACEELGISVPYGVDQSKNFDVYELVIRKGKLHREHRGRWSTKVPQRPMTENEITEMKFNLMKTVPASFHPMIEAMYFEQRQRDWSCSHIEWLSEFIGELNKSINNMNKEQS